MDAGIVLAVALGGLIGLALGLFGGGGSVLAFPVLVYVARMPPAAAVASSLAIVGATSLTASYAHARGGRVHARAALLFGGAGILTSFLGAKATHLVPDRALTLAFAGLMTAVGLWMVLGPRTGEENGTGRAQPRFAVATLAGAVVGVVTGFLGVGGGLLVVPALVAFTGLDVRTAVGTSLLVIAINSVAGLLGHLDAGRLDFALVGMLTVTAVAGAVAGERLARRFSTERLRQGFAALVLAVGLVTAVHTAIA